jgi:hypothetical protein
MIGMRMGMGLGAMQNSGGGATPAVWTIASDADGTQYVRIRCADTGQTLTVTGGAEIKLGSGGEWGTSVEIPAGDTDRYVYFRGNGIGGTLTFPNPENITYLSLFNTGTAITGSINGMALTYLHLYYTRTAITGSITGMELTYLYLCKTGTAITGSINGMALAYLYLYGTGTAITGVPPAIGKTLSSIRILSGDSYDYPWTEQTFAPPARTWTDTTMSIDCVAAAPTPAQFNTWLLGLASVSNAGTATLILKNTPTIAELNAAGYGETDTDSGYYAMTTTLGYTLTLGT